MITGSGNHDTKTDVMFYYLSTDLSNLYGFGWNENLWVDFSNIFGQWLAYSSKCVIHITLRAVGNL